jgi:ABC-type dipeptide/oligopeptide/nickel transport system ATPase component
VTIQAQIMEVLRAAQRETGASMVLISHDLGLIAEMADRVGDRARACPLRPPRA